MNSSFFPVASLLSSSSPVSFSSSSSSSAASPGEDQRSIWLLGAHYGPITDTDTRWGEYSKFLKDFHSRLWITYRSGELAFPSLHHHHHHYPPLPGLGDTMVMVMVMARVFFLSFLEVGKGIQ